MKDIIEFQKNKELDKKNNSNLLKKIAVGSLVAGGVTLGVKGLSTLAKNDLLTRKVVDNSKTTKLLSGGKTSQLNKLNIKVDSPLQSSQKLLPSGILARISNNKPSPDIDRLLTIPPAQKMLPAGKSSKIKSPTLDIDRSLAIPPGQKALPAGKSARINNDKQAPIIDRSLAIPPAQKMLSAGASGNTKLVDVLGYTRRNADGSITTVNPYTRQNKTTTKVEKIKDAMSSAQKPAYSLEELTEIGKKRKPSNVRNYNLPATVQQASVRRADIIDYDGEDSYLKLLTAEQSRTARKKKVTMTKEERIAQMKADRRQASESAQSAKDRVRAESKKKKEDRTIIQRIADGVKEETDKIFVKPNIQLPSVKSSAKSQPLFEDGVSVKTRLKKLLKLDDNFQQRLEEEFYTGLRNGMEARLVKNYLKQLGGGILPAELLDDIFYILSDADTEFKRIRNIVQQIKQLPDLMMDTMKEEGVKLQEVSDRLDEALEANMSRREFLKTGAKSTYRVGHEIVAEQVRFLTGDPGRATGIMKRVNARLRYNIAKAYYKPSAGGYVVKREGLDRLLRPLSPIDIEQSLFLEKLERDANSPWIKYLEDKFKRDFSNPFSMRRRLRTIAEVKKMQNSKKVYKPRQPNQRYRINPSNNNKK